MNREQRRKNKIAEKDPVLCIKRSVFDQKLQEMYQKGRKTASSEVISKLFTLLLGLPCKVLYDQYGWRTKKRLPEFAQSVLDLWEQFDESAESYEQMQEWIFRETGIKFEEGEE